MKLGLEDGCADGVDEGDWLGVKLGLEDGCVDAVSDGCAEGAEVGHVPGAPAMFKISPVGAGAHVVPSLSRLF